MGSSLNDRAMLTALHVSIWTGRSVDNEVTEEVSENHKADLKGAGVYSKQLVAPKFMRKVSSVSTLARTTHKLLTLPWSDEGERILSTKGYFHYTEQMRLRRHAFEAAITEFCDGLDEYIREAKVRLGTMFDVDDYPTKDVLLNKFSYDVEIKPIPEASDFRAKLTDASIKAISRDIERRGEERLEKAMKDIFLRVADVTGKMMERLREYAPAADGKPSENRFKDSLVFNVVELANLLPSLNVTDDPKIEALHQQILKDLGEHSPEVLRTDNKLRLKTADRAQQILDKVKRYI